MGGAEVKGQRRRLGNAKDGRALAGLAAVKFQEIKEADESTAF